MAALPLLRCPNPDCTQPYVIRNGSKNGRPRLVVPDAVRLTQTVTHRDAHGHLLRVEVVAAVGTVAEQPGTERVERVNGGLRDQVNALTRKTHAFAKRDAPWDALVGLAIFTQTGCVPIQRVVPVPRAPHRRWLAVSPTMSGPGRSFLPLLYRVTTQRSLNHDNSFL